MVQKFVDSWLRFFPEDFEPVNNNIAIERREDEVIFHTAVGPIYSYRKDDEFGFRLALAQMVTESLAKPTELANVLNINRTTIHRNVNKFKKHGPQGLLTKERVRKGYKLEGEALVKAQDLLDSGMAMYSVAKEVGVVEGTIRYAVKKGTLVKKKTTAVTKATERKIKTSSERSSEDISSSIGIGAKRDVDRVLASKGELVEAAPHFTPSEGVENAGVLLALPVLASLGLFDAGKQVYGKLRNGYYGLRSTLLALAIMTLLRIKSPEQLKNHSPGELGILLGLDRIHEVNTLRSKLRELGHRDKAGEFSSFLTNLWCEQDKEAIGFVYIDGHVRPYHGRKHKLPKTHVARRRLCMPATTDFWVNDKNCEPLFFITADANNGMLSMLEDEVIPELRKLAGDGNRVTMIFDREGWSPDSFRRWADDGIDVITYRKGDYDPWPEECFLETKCTERGKTVKYLLGERSTLLYPKSKKRRFWMREVRRLCDDGHQTSVMTTRQDLDINQIAQKMFARWNQENFFRYMRHEYALDNLVAYDVIPADVERMIPNPEKKEKRKELTKLKGVLTKKLNKYGELALNNNQQLRPTMRGFNIANPGVKNEISDLVDQVEKTKTELSQIPEKVAIKEVLDENEVVRLETERKRITDTIKICCYRAETAMMNFMAEHLKKNNEEGRSFLKSVYKLKGDIIPDEEKRTLGINLHTMSNRRSNRALRELCEVMNAEEMKYPGTNLKMVFKAP